MNITGINFNFDIFLFPSVSQKGDVEFQVLHDLHW